jgi:hypothetical protein
MMNLIGTFQQRSLLEDSSQTTLDVVSRCEPLQHLGAYIKQEIVHASLTALRAPSHLSMNRLY